MCNALFFHSYFSLVSIFFSVSVSPSPQIYYFSFFLFYFIFVISMFPITFYISFLMYIENLVSCHVYCLMSFILSFFFFPLPQNYFMFSTLWKLFSVIFLDFVPTFFLVSNVVSLLSFFMFFFSAVVYYFIIVSRHLKIFCVSIADVLFSFFCFFSLHVVHF